MRRLVTLAIALAFLAVLPLAAPSEGTTTCTFTTVGSTATLDGDCTTDATILVPNGVTLDGATQHDLVVRVLRHRSGDVRCSGHQDRIGLQQVEQGLDIVLGDVIPASNAGVAQRGGNFGDEIRGDNQQIATRPPGVQDLCSRSFLDEQAGDKDIGVKDDAQHRGPSRRPAHRPRRGPP